MVIKVLYINECFRVFCQQTISVSLHHTVFLWLKQSKGCSLNVPVTQSLSGRLKHFVGWSFPFLLICTGRNFLSPFNRHCPFLRARTATSRCKQTSFSRKWVLQTFVAFVIQTRLFFPSCCSRHSRDFLFCGNLKKIKSCSLTCCVTHSIWTTKIRAWILLADAILDHTVPPKVRQRVYEKIVKVYYLCFYNAVIRHCCLSWIKCLWRKQKSSLKCAHF